jgi:hypothetical protein
MDGWMDEWVGRCECMDRWMGVGVRMNVNTYI